MRAVVLFSNKKLLVENIPLQMPDPNECQIQIAATGVCSSDIFRSCNNGAYFYPLVMGHELSGVIVEVGREVKNFKVGDKVAVYPLIPCEKCNYCLKNSYIHCKNYDYYGSRRNGGFAEYLNVKEWNLISIPESIKLESAAALEPLSVCIHALKRCGLYNKNSVSKNLDRGHVAILGAGFLGLLCAKLLNWISPNLSVSLIDRNKFKLDLNTNNIHQNICLSKNEDWFEYIKENSDQFSHVIESCGSPDTFRYSIQLAKHGGTIVWMGNIYSDLEIPKTMVSSILRKELNIKGTWNSSYDPRSHDSDWTDAVALLDNGFDFETLISERIGLEDLPSKMIQLHSHKSRESVFNGIKILVIPSLNTERSAN